MANAAVGTLYSSDAYTEKLKVWVPEKEEPKAGPFAVKKPDNDVVTNWVSGTVKKVLRKIDEYNSELLILTETGQEVQILSSECPLQNERDDQIDDLVRSDFLHEPGILHTLKVRYALESIYTYSGNILIAANPHKKVKNIYGPRMMLQYRDQQLGELSPHVYAIAEQAFSSMVIDECKQAILISGESGAGKTESAKLVMQYLAQRAAPANAFMTTQQLAKTMSKIPIEEQVLESNPLLEAFGNAKTSRNENSSRFGKFVEIFFDRVGKVLGAAIRTYLLERSRVVSIASPERSYHIFYQLITGANEEQRKKFKLEGGLQAFRLLTDSDMFTLSKVKDEEEFRHTQAAMDKVGISPQSQDAILAITAAVLHLNNVQFEGRDEAEPKSKAAEAALRNAAELLQVDYDQFKDALTTKEVKVVTDIIKKPLGAKEAKENVDALAKSIYSRLFDWIVGAINDRIQVGGAARHSHRVIGILDIYGFEHFQVNSFEQLCINLANERLQQQFNSHVFKAEQQIYIDEGIDWTRVDFVDNQECLDLLEGSDTLPGIFPLVDEACKIANVTPENLALDLEQKLAVSSRFRARKRPLHSFSVDHYAGQVVYSADLMIDKNKDFVVESHQRVMESSGLELVRMLFPPEPKPAEEAPPEGARPPGRGRPRQQKAIKFRSVGASFRQQLAGLMATLNSCQPHYIRCIKPNPRSIPGQLDPAYSLEQLRAGGVLEAVRIACAGFPTRKDIVPFAIRYSMLLSRDELGDWAPSEQLQQQQQQQQPASATAADDSDAETTDADIAEARRIAELVLKKEGLETAQMGKTRVFLRAGQLAQLEASRTRRMAAAATVIQSAYRMHREVVRYRKIRAAILKIQAHYLGHKLREKFLLHRANQRAIVIQKYWRGYQARKLAQRMREERAAIVIQKNVRRYLARKRYLHETEVGRKQRDKQQRDWAARVLQKYVRRWIRLHRIRKERERMRQLRELEERVASLTQEVAFWQNKSEDSDATVQEMRANVKTLQNELELVKAQAAEKARQEIESAARRAHESALNEIRVMKQQREEAEARLEEVRTEQQELTRQLLERSEQLAETKDCLDEARTALLRLKQEAIERDEQHRAALEEGQREVAGVRDQLRKANISFQVQQAALKKQMEDLKRKPAIDAEVLRRLEEGTKARDEAAHLRSKLSEQSEDNHTLASRLQDREEHVKLLERKLTEMNINLGDLSKESLLGQQQIKALRPGQLRATQSITGQDLVLEGEKRTSLAGYFQNNEPVEILLEAVVEAKLPKIPLPTTRLPLGSWIMSRSLFEWCRVWSEDELFACVGRVQLVLNSAMAKDFSLAGRTYWYQTLLGTCGLLNSYASTLNSHILRDMAEQLLKYRATQDHFKEILLEQVKLNPAELLSAKWGKLLRHKSRADRQAQMQEGMMGRLAPWERLKGALTNLVAALKREGLPAPAVKAITLALLAFIDAQVLNNLMLRRDCCSTSAVKALQKGVQELRKWATFTGVAWCGNIEQVDHQLRHLNQAVRYMLQGKDELMRIAKHSDIKPSLKRYTRDLSIAQIYKLTEHHFDDWTATSISPGTEVLGLLERLKGIQESDMKTLTASTTKVYRRASSNTSHAGDGVPAIDQDELLLDSEEVFQFDHHLLQQAVRAYFDGDTKQAMATLQVQLARQELPDKIATCPDLAFLKQSVKR